MNLSRFFHTSSVGHSSEREQPLQSPSRQATGARLPSDGDADAQQVDRQVTRELKHKAVDDKLENAQRNDRERQRDDREERFDERIDNVQEQSHKGKADPGLGKAEGLDTGDEERANSAQPANAENSFMLELASYL